MVNIVCNYDGLQMTMKDQKDPNNWVRWVMSRFPTCNTLNSIYDGDRKLILRRGLYLFKK